MAARFLALSSAVAAFLCRLASTFWLATRAGQRIDPTVSSKPGPRNQGAMVVGRSNDLPGRSTSRTP
eukprot:5750197-Alexandrium_andersonii.AAC.1